jgi:hypothetical protein
MHFCFLLPSFGAVRPAKLNSYCSGSASPDISQNHTLTIKYKSMRYLKMIKSSQAVEDSEEIRKRQLNRREGQEGVEGAESIILANRR